MAELYRLEFANGKFYIGATAHLSILRYRAHARAAERGSKLAVHNAWRSLGAPKLTILAVVERYDVFEAERRAISIFGTLVPGGYNLAMGGLESPTTSALVAAKVSLALKGRPRPDWVRVKIGNGNRGKIRPQSVIDAMVASHTTPEYLALASALNRGKNNPRFGISPTSETRKKMSASSMGRRNTPEHNANIARAKTGFVLSAESRLKMSISARNRKKKS